MKHSNGEDQAGSIPLVLLAAIILGGLIIALFMDVSTGIRLASADRDFHQAVQVADAGLQDAFVVLSTLEDGAKPAVGQEFDEPFTGTLGRGAYTWNATRVGSDRWEVRAIGDFGDHDRALEATMGPMAIWEDAAFGDQWVRMIGNNYADSYPSGDRGTVGTNGYVDLNNNVQVDGIGLFGGAEVRRSGTIRSGGSPIHYSKERDLPRLGALAFTVDGECYDRDLENDLTLPLVRGEIYCVRQATFPSGTHNLVDNEDLSKNSNPTEIYVYLDGDVEIEGGGSNAAKVNMELEADGWPNASALEIYLDTGRFRMGNHTEIAAAIHGPDATCTGNPSAAQADVYGSIVCGSLGAASQGNQGGWAFHYDERLAQVESQYFAITSVREELTSTTSFGASGN